MSGKADTFPFFSLPYELRTKIYTLLLVPDQDDSQFLHGNEFVPFVRDYHLYEPTLGSSDQRRLLKFRNLNPTPKMKRRMKYKVRLVRMRSGCEDASYACINKPELHTAIFGASRRTYEEAAKTFYGSYIFDFDTHIEACVPFLMDRMPYSRGCIKHVSIVKRSLPYDKDFDRCEWSNMCEYLRDQLNLAECSLGVVAGKPAIGWDLVPRFRPDDFPTIVERTDEMAWVNDISSIQGLKRLHVRACVEHTPPPTSNAMAFFIAFSASIEPYFAEYLTARMVM